MERASWLGPSLTLVGILLTELLGHVFTSAIPGARLLAVGILLASFSAVAYTALTKGFAWGAATTAILAVYTPHYSSPHAEIVRLTAEELSGAIIMLGIGLAISAPMELVRRREERLRSLLRARAEALEQRNEELTDANAALEAFGYVVSHDLKEPVRAIENYLAAAREEYGEKEGRRYVDEAFEANRRLTALLHGLLAYSRAATLPVAPRPVSVRDALTSETARSIYGGLVSERKAEVKLAEDLPTVLGDEVILAQLFGNLIVNAVRHNPAQKPRVEIRAEPPHDGHVHVVVADNGPGFPPDVVRRVAELKGTRPTTLRGGFGLVISARAAQRLEGRLWIANGANGGEAHVELKAA